MKKVVLLTGASAGMGKETAKLLAQQGYTVYGAARRIDRMGDLAQLGINVIQMDVTNDDSMVKGVEELIATEGKIDILINNAGFGFYGAIEDVPIADAKYQLEVNLFGAARLIQLVLPYMRQQQAGKIVNISSIGGKMATPLGGWYHASKFALEGLSDSLRNEVKPFGIDVIVIEPGGVKSEWGSIAFDSLVKVSGHTAYKSMVEKFTNSFKATEDKNPEPIIIAELIQKAIEARKPKAASQHMMNTQSNILYSCVVEQKRGNEQFVPEHALGYMLSGESHFFTNSGNQIFEAGAIGLVKRNQLVKTIKVPPPGGEFKAINIILDQETLHRYSAENQIEASGQHTDISLRQLQLDPFLKGYFDSLLPYFDHPEQLSPALIELKTKEAIELLLRFDYSLKDFLFDFSEPHKIDLEAFMIQNYNYNVPINQFAKLTGRSLATFKRDFQRVFNTSPQRWLQQKRLEQAHFLIAERSQRPSNVYLEVGFENLSHFSAAFKQQFGYNPSSL